MSEISFSSVPLNQQNNDLKRIRVSEWKAQLEHEIQNLMTEAAQLKKTINESKTSTKKQFYTKKFKKVSADTIQLLTALQSIISYDPEEVPAHDTTTA